MTYADEARRILQRISSERRTCAVYIGDRGHALVRPAITARGEPSRLVDSAIDRGALVGVYDSRCKPHWLEEDLRYCGA